MQLYDYWRSSAAYRVRIALNLKGLAYQPIPIDLRKGAQRSSAYRARNPQGLVPYLQDGEVGIGQSFAIMEYLDERYPRPPLLPKEPAARAYVRALALAIVCEIHPLNNLRVLQYLEQRGDPEPDRLAWYRHWVGQGFEPIEAVLAERGDPFCFGDTATLADICLVPQVYNARRYSCDLEPYPTIRAIDQRCRQIEAFAKAAPELQPDAVTNG
jgi:maleylpyruvate isomerase